MPEGTPEPRAIDERVIKDMFGDDPETFKEILTSFVEPSRAIIAEVGLASDALNDDGVRHGAHQLKSSARTIGANALADTCAALEAAGRTGDWEAIGRLMPRAQAQMTAVLSYIAGL
jgi:HPt (histidine-containing phosphotransfer) domain-containing protein